MVSMNQNQLERVFAFLCPNTLLINKIENVINPQDQLFSLDVATPSGHDHILDGARRMYVSGNVGSSIVHEGIIVLKLKLLQIIEHGMDLGDKAGVVPPHCKERVVLPA